MKSIGRIVLLALLASVVVISTGCGYHYKCNVTFGGPPCGSGGTVGLTGGSTGGNGTGNGGGAADLLYTLPSGGTGGFLLHGAVLTSTGTFAPLTGVQLPTVPIAFYTDFAIVNKAFLYIPNTTENSGVVGVAEVHAFIVNHADGSLSAVSGSPFQTSQSFSDTVVSDKQGKFLFIGDRGGFNFVGASIASFLINPTTGALTAAPGSPILVPGSPNVMAVDGSGKYLYASFATAGGIMGFNIDQTTGALTPMVGSPFNVNAGTNMTDIKTDSTGKFLIGTTNTFSDSTNPAPDPHLYVISIDQTTGALNTAVPFPTTNLAFAVTTNPVTPFVYGFAEDATGSPTGIEGFSLDASGTLTPIPGSPFTALAGGFFGKFDQNGTQLFYPVPNSKIGVAGANATSGVLTQTAVPMLLDTSDVFAVTN